MAHKLTIAAVIVFLASPVLADESGFLTDYSLLGAAPAEAGVDRWYVAPDVATYLAKSRGVFVDSTEFFIADDSKYKGMKPEDMALIGNSMRDAVMRELHGSFTVLDYADEGAIVVRMALSNVHLKKHKKGLLSYTPVGLAAGAVKGAFDDVMDKIDLQVAAVEIEIVDVSSGTILGAATVQRAAESKKKTISWEDVQAYFTLSGKRLTCRLNNAQLDEGSRVDCMTLQ